MFAGQRAVNVPPAFSLGDGSGGIGIPGCPTKAFESRCGSTDRSIRRPLAEIIRANAACRIFVASKLPAAISCRWPVKLHGMPAHSPAINAAPAALDAQYA